MNAQIPKRIGVIGIIVENRRQTAPQVNRLLSEFGELVVGRMGIPNRERGIGVIALIIEATTDEIGALTGRLGQLPGVQVKANLV